MFKCVCEYESMRVCVAFCLPCLIMRLHAHKGKSQTGDTPNQTTHGRRRTRHATPCYALRQPFFMIIIFIFYLFTCAFDRVDSRCLFCLCVCVCVCSNLMAFYAAADQLKTADLARFDCVCVA